MSSTFLCRKFEAIMDDMSPEEILAQAQAAAREAAVELTLRKPNSKVGGWREDGIADEPCVGALRQM